MEIANDKREDQFIKIGVIACVGTVASLAKYTVYRQIVRLRTASRTHAPTSLLKNSWKCQLFRNLRFIRCNVKRKAISYQMQ